MSLKDIKSLRFLLSLFLPVAGVVLLAGALNWVSFSNLRQDYLDTVAHQEQDSRRIAEISSLNHHMAQVQIEVGEMLEKGASGAVDEGQMYLFHSDVVNRLALLQATIQAMQTDASSQDELLQAQGDFQNYHRFLIMATDLASIDPLDAMRHAFSASQAHVKVAEHLHSIANTIALEITQHNQENAQAFKTQAVHTGVLGAVMMAAVLLLWLLISERVTRRLSRLSEALSAFEQNDTNPPTLPMVRRLSQQKNSLLRDMAVSVLAFRDSIMARQQAQYDLAERMKELSCLYDVKALTENRSGALSDILAAVVQRLPAGLRYPERAVGWIDYQGQRYGSRADGESLSVRFGGTAQQPDLLGVAYTAPLPTDAGAPFLTEEETLLAAMAQRLSDMVAMRRSQALLAQSDRALRTARQCAQLLIRALHEDQLMQDICRLAVEVGGYRVAWVGLAQHDAACSVLPVASFGFTDNYLQTAQISWANVVRGQGITGTAIREARTTVARDILTNPAMAPWHEAAVQNGYGSSVSMPLFDEQGQCFGALSLYAAEVDAFSEAEVELLNEMANDLSFGIRTLRTRAALHANYAEMRKLSLVVEQSPNAIIITNMEPRIEYVNEAFVRNTGFSREQVLGQNPSLLKSEKTPAATYQAMWQTLGEGRAWSGELTNSTHDGQDQIEAAIIIPLIQSDGAITHYVAIKEDITEKKRMGDELARHREHLEVLVVERTEALARKEDELRLLLESTSEGIFGVGADGRITFANAAAVQMLRYGDAAQLVGQPSHTALHRSRADSGDSAPQDNRIEHAMRANAAVRCDTEVFWRQDGSSFAVAYAAAPLVRHGAVVGMVVAFQDITERKRAEVALLQAKASAEAATRSKSDFLANMSHEIRTPMNAIIGMSHLALKTNLDKRQRNYLEKVLRSGQNLLGIINDILDFSKIEAGQMHMETVDFNLDDVMDNLAHLVGLKTEDKGLELLFDTAPDVPTALIGDPLRLGQVLINLGNNAAKFTERGEIVVGIDKVADHDGGVQLHFWVRDTGIGMSAEQCQKMFQSFSQADTSTTRKYGGTGLGLAISKKLVEAMHGKIWLESAVGQGSTLHFEARFGVQAQPYPRRMFNAQELQGVRLLVVDDNAAAREILATMAHSFGLEVDTASDGAEALRKVAAADQQALPYDLVLMDWKMPQMDGVETAHHLQRTHASRVPTVIMVTAYGREDALARADERGVALHTVLTKPVTPSHLLEAIGEALGKGSAVITRKEVRADGYAEAARQLQGARLLLVEDNDLNQELVMDLLADAGISVVLAEHGQEALDILAQDPHFDGVLMDCQMPVMDGYTATRALRKKPAFNHLPIIAMTASAMVGDKEKVLAAGMCDHIAKPLDVAAMFVTLAQWIHPAAAAKAAQDNANLIAAAVDGISASGHFDDLFLPGIDTEFGLATALHKPALYRRLLIKFRDRQAHFAALFAQARTGTDSSAAQRCAHTLRGTAATVGAKGVQAAAAALELACQQPTSAAHIEPLLQQVLQALEPVVRGLQALGDEDPGLSAAAPPAVALPINADQLSALRQRLVALLERGDASALDLCAQQAAPLAAAYPAHWPAIADSISHFDFEAALALRENKGLLAKM